ncbi:hypothetical protein QOZ80_3AG0244420 [Eleusine coracana subsp. coracana]|nr:hypothetical protein QOZ80_3AG0244420 [Eleusine coracana subsp. coracana]
MASSSAATDPLVHVAFNSDATHFVAASSSGIRVFSCNPFEHVFSRSGFASPDGSGSAGEVTAADVALPLVAAVVFGDTIRYWSERHGQMMSEAAMAPTRVMEVETGPNPWGACALAQTTTTDGGHSFVLACPSLVGGDVQIWHGADEEGHRVDVRTRSGERDVACLELSRDARLLCTTDSWGRVLCIFSTADGIILQQRQNLRGAPNADELMDPHTTAYIITSYMTEMPVATFRLVPGVRYVAAFGQEPNTIQVISMLGSFYRCQFDPVRGHRKQVEHIDLTEMKWTTIQQ